MTISRIALAGLLGLAALTPAVAQIQPHILNLTRDERNALRTLQTAAAGTDRAAQDAALAAARTAAQGADARYAVANIQFQLGRSRGDAQMQNQAIDALVASGVPQGAELAPLLSAQASRAYSANNLRGADALLARAVELQPNSAAAAADYAQYKARLGDRPAAVTLFQRAFQLQRAASQPVPQSWYLRALALAFDGRLAPQAAAIGRELVAAYPTPGNWRDALFAYRQLGAAADPALDLDIRRLTLATGCLAGEREYVEYATALNRAGAPGAAKAVIDEGVARGMLTATDPEVRPLLTAANSAVTRARAGLAASRTRAQSAADGTAALAAGDAHLDLGQYAEAATLYRTALQKGGVDANVANSRLGAALALGGQRAEAATAFSAVTGPRAELAGYWTAWLATSRPAA
jgi:tetratricopeptide (TPR) repeat protein